MSALFAEAGCVAAQSRRKQEEDEEKLEEDARWAYPVGKFGMPNPKEPA